MVIDNNCRKRETVSIYIYIYIYIKSVKRVQVVVLADLQVSPSSLINN